MSIAQAAFHALAAEPFAWGADRAWGLPLIVLTVVIHVAGLGLVNQKAVEVATRMMCRRHPKIAFLTIIGATTLFATCLQGIEAGFWAAAYRFLGALPDFKTSMLFSLNAMTTYGQTNLSAKDRWRLMGSLEALNGSLPFGLTAAFLFAVMQKVWVVESSMGTGAG